MTGSLPYPYYKIKTYPFTCNARQHEGYTESGECITHCLAVFGESPCMGSLEKFRKSIIAAPAVRLSKRQFDNNNFGEPFVWQLGRQKGA